MTRVNSLQPMWPSSVPPEPSLFVCAQHYGLTRTRLPSGRYEPIRIGHSWNANWMATSAVTFRLQRHADHHMFGSKPYQVHTLRLMLDVATAS